MKNKLINIKKAFDIYTAKSKAFDDYSSGDTPFVSNGFYNNGVVGFVDPFDNDRVFTKMSICVSAFCEATVHKAPFLPRGNGGSGLIVLTPKTEMTYDELLKYSGYINACLKWKYSYGRMVTKGRFEKKDIPSTLALKNKFENKIGELIPKHDKPNSQKLNISFERVPITKLFTLKHGDFHSLNDLDTGDIPTVSRSSDNNGVVGFHAMPDDAELYEPLTITVSTVSGDSFVQLDKYIATDNVVVCTPKVKMSIETLFFIAMMLNREKWRWLYGRQCYKTKFSKTEVFLPLKNNKIDEDIIATIVKNGWGWKFVKGYINAV